MADPIVTALTAVTKEEIWPRQITDSFFRAIPFFSYIRDKALITFSGMTFMQYPYLFRPMIGGAYSPGSAFNIDKVDTIAALQFREKYYEVNVTEFKEEIQVRNKGTNAVFSLLDADMKNAMMTMTTIIAISAWRHGQTSGGGVVDDRSLEINGLSEALNDGILPSWDGNIFPNYGAQARNGAIGKALNSKPYWLGNSNGTAGKITYEKLEDMYQIASQGNLSPDLGVTSKRGMTLIKNTLQVQQRFAQETDPRYGYEGILLNRMRLTKDDYCPSASTADGGTGDSDPILGNWLTADFAYTDPGAATRGNFPAANVTLQPREVIFMLNTDTWILRISDDEEFQFGWTGFKPGQDNTRVSGQSLAAINLENPAANRLNIHGYGFNS
jgi:hypothetical protein